MKSNILTSWLLQRETLVALGDQQRIGRGGGGGGGSVFQPTSSRLLKRGPSAALDP